MNIKHTLISTFIITAVGLSGVSNAKPYSNDKDHKQRTIKKVVVSHKPVRQRTAKKVVAVHKPVKHRNAKKVLVNHKPAASKTKKLKHKSKRRNTYRVKRGDNLYKVAKKTGVSVRKLIRLNRDKLSHKNRFRLRIGQRLRLKRSTRR